MFRLPTKTIVNEGGLLRLPEAIQKHISQNISSVLIVTDQGFRENTNWVEHLTHALQESLQCDVELYDQTPVNPRLETVEQISSIALSKKCDLMLSIGGGSAIDAGKAAAMYASPINNTQPLRSFCGAPNLHSNEVNIPFIAIPSTCGTGSEATWVSVLTDDDIKRKISIKGDALFPDVAYVDCDLLKTLPSSLIAWTSMDALTHALEAYTANCANQISDILAVKAIDLLFEYIPRAVHKIKQDRFARYHVAVASNIAGMAFGNADVGAVHCLSETLGGMYDIPHGLANSAILYSVMMYHRPFIRDKLVALAQQIHIEKKIVYHMLCMEYEGGEKALKKLPKDEVFLLCLNRLRSEIGNVLKAFDALNVDSNDWNHIAKECVANGSNASNPQPMKESNYIDVLNMLQEDQISYIRNPCHTQQ